MEAIDAIHLDCVLLCIAKNIEKTPRGANRPLGFEQPGSWICSGKIYGNLALMGNRQ